LREPETVGTERAGVEAETVDDASRCWAVETKIAVCGVENLVGAAKVGSYDEISAHLEKVYTICLMKIG
jgi:hypothetical protein